MKKWEFSGNLDATNGIVNYSIFKETVNKVMREYWRVFTPLVIHKYPLLIDNAIVGSGHTPIITPILNEYLIIKLCIKDGKNIGQTIFQFAHELTHLVFYSLLGLDKNRAGNKEESLCTAASLCVVKSHSPNELGYYIDYVSKLQNEGYKNGLQVAVEHDFDLNKLRESILLFAKEQNE